MPGEHRHGGNTNLGTQSVTPQSATAQELRARELLLRWQAGDAAAFRGLFDEFRSLVFGVLCHLLPRERDLEDVVQQTFLEIFRSLDKFQGKSRLSSWIVRIALNVGYHHLRYARSRPAKFVSEQGIAELRDDSPWMDPYQCVESHQAITRLYAVLEALPPKKRTVFILSELEGLPHEEIAEVVGASVATVRTRLFYARQDFWDRAAHDALLAKLADELRILPEQRSKSAVGQASKRHVR